MFKRNLIPISILVLICFFIMKPEIVSEGAFNGLKIWVYNIIPFLFPISILSNILLQYNFLYSLFERISSISNKIFKSKYALIPFFISFISGYPSGAMAVNIMANNKRINETEANYLIVFANDCSFQFIAGAVSFSMLGDFSLYKYIAIPHFLGAIILSLLMVKNEPRLSMSMKAKQKSVTFNEAFSNAIYKSVTGILSVGGVIVIFSVLSKFFDSSIKSLTLLLSLNSNMSQIIYSLLVGSLEITNGCSIISSSTSMPMEIKLLVINFLISFSGMSVIFQTMAVINEFKFNINRYIGYKFIHGIISALIYIAMLIFI
ncbi:MAG: hypothetical protein SA378_09070 [Sedimentibacter sp.]|uniref:hypothetical protein n=1 Tax=Sedimentibacter sp. TaxID=1960295 RepID=UPI0029813FFD|nr:hypothetical protein [Sedimentibacter sp.]MDW5300274.1 hypothetical protein [Sedimentibacter sp.]